MQMTPLYVLRHVQRGSRDWGINGRSREVAAASRDSSSLFSLLFSQRISIVDTQTSSEPPRPGSLPPSLSPGKNSTVPVLSALSFTFSVHRVRPLLCVILLKVPFTTYWVSSVDPVIILPLWGLASSFLLLFFHTVTATLDPKPCSWPGDLPGSPEHICSASILGGVLTVVLA